YIQKNIKRYALIKKIVYLLKIIIMIIQNEKLLTVRETAKILLLSAQTVRKWINSGKLQAVKIGKEYRVKISEINEMIN
ncbi:DNA-binding protein, partial [bacterium]|nr:DNA-binding protein [bacterium]